MNIFEIIWLTLIVAGAAAGGMFGHSHFGIWGAILGIPVGMAVGFLGALACAFFLAVPFKALWGGTLFPPREPRAANGSNGKIKDA